MNGEVQLIVGSITTVTQQIVTTFNLQGSFFVNPMPMGYFGAAPPNICTIGSTILLTDSDNPETWTVLATLTIDSSDPTAQTFTFTTGDYIDPDVIYYVTLYSNITTDSTTILDLFENESISQNWKFQDLTNFTAQGAFSREFRVPYSENNQLALGPLFDINVDAGTSNYFHYKLPAEIRVDTLPIATGYIRVRKIYRQKNRINEVELAFYAETPDLVRNIGEKRLKDIADLTTLNEVVHYNNVTTSSATKIWTVVDRGQAWSDAGEINTRPLTNAANPVYPADLTPALSWWYLFSNIISEAGFELVAGTLENILENYWMPFLNSSNIIGTDSFNEYFFRVYNGASIVIPTVSTAITFNNEIFDNSGDYNPAVSEYTTPTGGYYTFRFCNKFTVAGQINTVSYFLEIDGQQIFLDTFNVFNNQFVDFTYRIGIDAGSVVKVRIKSNNATPAVTLVAGDGTYNTSIFELVKTEFLYGQTIYYNLNAPDMKQIDFVTDVIKMHNCAIVADRIVNNKIYIVPQNSYLGSGDTLDWTGKLDIDKDIVISSAVDLQKGRFQFTYTTGEDYISQQYKNTNRIYGDYEAIGYTINPNTEPSDFAIGDQKIQLVTQSTPAGIVNGSGYVFPMFINSSQNFVVPGPRCLFEAGTINIQLYDENAPGAQETAVSVLNHYSQVFADIDDVDLNWAPETPAHAILSNPYNNLFNQYWRTYMNALYSPEARIMDAAFALDLKDILTFKFSDKIWIQDSYWRILEINDYKVGLNESTQVKLIKFLEDTEDCTGTPVSISTNGEVNFEDGNGDPVEATEDCCSRYGYNWDEVNAICWAFTQSGSRPTSGVTGSKTNPSPRITKSAVQNRSIQNSVITGDTVAIEVNNKDMLAVGNTLELDYAVNGSNLLGKNTYTRLPGIHLGGGWKDNITTTTEKGWAQSGTVILHLKDNFIDSQITAIPIEGVTGEDIILPDSTIWSMLMNVTVLDTTTENYYTAQISGGIQKTGGAANTSALTVLNEYNTTPFLFTFLIDVATDSTKHIITMQPSGLGLATENFVITISIHYQQNTYA